ncbi:MAG: site-specific DNA-methyltransferase [Bacteroides sp.]|nr:site-specific DNA-methyltransferase [Bacteroides sp.]
MAVGILTYKNTNGLMNLSLIEGKRIIGNNICDGTIKRLYHADNLSVLKRLLKDQTVKGNIKLIYIDPPYNTGADFETRNQEFAYSDRFSIEEYIDFMRERLITMRELLSCDGSIYVHLDSNMVFHVKLLMDSIFGINNFRGMITRKKCKPKNYTRKTYGNISDYILFYTKSDSPTWNRPYDKWEEEKIKKEYPFIEENTGRRYKRVPIHAPGIRNGATGSKWRGMLPPPGKHWQYTPDKLDELDANNEIYWSSNGNPRRKVYLDQSKGIPVQDIWLDFLDVNNQNSLQTGYPTEKNLEMIKRIIEASSNEGDLIMDCFAGSGTTLIAAEELNRQWIGVDIGDVAIETIQKRLEFGSKKLSELDNSYKVKNNQGSLFEFSDNNTMETNNVSMVKEKEKSISYEFFQML